MTFRMDNTEGFTSSDLRELNAALTTLLGGSPDECDEQEVKAASDMLNNAWDGEGNTADYLVSKVRSLGFYRAA